MKKFLKIGILVAVLIIIIIYIITSLWIGSDVKRYCKNAKKIYPGDCVSVLSQLVIDNSMPYRDRNQAIWALGQLGDPRGLTYITKFYTGKVKDKESQETELSQHEIEKAIRLMQGSFNMSAIVWRHGIK